MISRRLFLQTTAFAAAAPTSLWAAPAKRFAALPAAFAKLEKDSSARLGVFVLDTGSGETAGHRAKERFAMCSTFKSLLAAAVLERVDARQDDLKRSLQVPATGLMEHSPLTEPHAGKTMTLRELGFAIVTQSDNTAANMLLEVIGGPAGMTQFARSLGDTVTRLDRTETTLNESKPGDPRDTTSPLAMVEDWQKLLLGDALSPASRALLLEWLIGNQTGGERLRKGLPQTWKIGDKTGSNGSTTTNDVAILWPEAGKPPVLVAAYLTECTGTEDKRNGVIAQVGRLLAAALDAH